MLKLKIIVIILGMLLISTGIYASVTANEFIPCKKLAVTVLESCFNNDENKCWVKSKETYKSCYKKVLQQHAPDKDRIYKVNRGRQPLADTELSIFDGCLL